MGREQLIHIAYDAPYDKPIVLCLGFFDSLHLGHQSLFVRAKTVAEKYNAQTAVFTFDNNPFEILHQDSKQVMTLQERCYRLEQYGIDCVMTAQFTSTFAALEPKAFIERILQEKQVRGIVVGNDYTFGAKAKGNIELLTELCKQHGIQLDVLEMKCLPDGEKIASRTLRQWVRAGEVERIRECLGVPYLLIGTVVHGRGQGKPLGFPTANVWYPTEKERLLAGVYATRVTVDGVPLRAVTNVGNHPTFGDDRFNVESHILHYDGDLYGKTIAIEFYRKIRDICKYTNVEALRDAIAQDVASVDQAKE